MLLANIQMLPVTARKKDTQYTLITTTRLISKRLSFAFIVHVQELLSLPLEL